MMLSSASRYLRQLSSRFVKSEDGNVAILLGLAIVPIFAVIGVSIDYGRAASARSAMQAAADAAALMVAKDVNASASTDVKKKAEAYFKALLNRPDLANVAVNAAYTTTASSGQSVKIDANAAIPNSFMSMSMLGSTKTTSIGTSSTVRWGNARYRVALALDNTGSMAASGKMDELKKAAKQLIEDFASMAKTDADIYISIVPFAETVRISSGFKTANWVKWSAATGDPDIDGWDDLHGTCKSLPFPASLTAGTKNTRVKCTAAKGTWQPDTRPATWTGCVMDRDKTFDANNIVPASGTPGSMVWAFNNPDDATEDKTLCPSEILGMTPVKSQKQVLLDKITAMESRGATNQTIGTAWAWLTHTVGAGPYPAPAKEANYDYKDVIILLTDGANTRNRWDGDGFSQSAAVDARQALLCSNIADAKFSVFAIQVSTASEPVSAVTKACASYPNDPTYYSNISQASQMSVKFKSIFEALARLRVTE